ncbi:hypothetical protein FBEOM_4187 [Fusarium beomiforme]|uniref:Uncharacterized protein n=1 Tax=Fusarium beomiforme TaxID=44412 RepID=A0A9P5AN91_9HYPO|nr:hypothetical protein FBEOM_4187 [Fusarium beomiforme]
MQNIQLLGTLLMSVGQQYGVILRSIDKECEIARDQNEPKRLHFSDSGEQASTKMPIYGVELSPFEWSSLAKKAVRAEVYGNGSDEDTLWSLLNYLEERQAHWHAVPPHEDCPHQDQTEEEPFCIKIILRVKDLIQALKWKNVGVEGEKD